MGRSPFTLTGWVPFNHCAQLWLKCKKHFNTATIPLLNAWSIRYEVYRDSWAVQHESKTSACSIVAPSFQRPIKKTINQLGRSRSHIIVHMLISLISNSVNCYLISTDKCYTLLLLYVYGKCTRFNVLPEVSHVRLAKTTPQTAKHDSKLAINIVLYVLMLSTIKVGCTSATHIQKSNNFTR